LEKLILFFLVLLFGSLPLSIAATQINLGFLLVLGIVQYGVLKRPFIFTPLDKPILLFLFFILISGLLGKNPVLSFKDFIESNWFICLYLMVVNFIKTRKIAVLLLCVMFAAGGLNGLYGIIQNLTGGLDLFQPTGSENILKYGDQIRATGTFSIYMTFAGQMILLLLFGIGFLLWFPKNPMALFLIFTLPPIFAGLLFSFVRGAWLGLISGILFVGFFKKKKHFLLIICPLMILMVSIIIFYSPFRQRAVGIINTQTDYSNLERIHIWTTSYEIFKDYPIMGIGGGNFRDVMDKYQNRKSFSHAHNNFIQIGVENGLIGLALYLYIWFLFFKEGFLATKKGLDPFSKGVILGGIAALVGFHIAGLFEYNFGDAEVAMMMWVLVGFTFAGGKGHFAA